VSGLGRGNTSGSSIHGVSVMGRARKFALLLGSAAAAAAVARHVRRAHSGRRVAGGILIGDPVLYDALSHRLLLGSLFTGIAADVAAVAAEDAGVLEVGCGPGRLSIRLARQHGLDVTGLDLDPVMIEQARANANRPGDGRRPSFLVGDVASLAFPDRSFDMVVSTLSMHHWADPAAGLAEIGRVLRPGGRAVVWDLRPGGRPIPPTRLRPGRPCPWHSTASGERDDMALALEGQAHPAERAGSGGCIGRGHLTPEGRPG
jgi:SAM-dependent methyltransferase